MASIGEISGDGGKQRERWIAVYIAILAVALSICSVGGGNATKDATARNIEASNAWAFFQAKNIRRNHVRIEINELELRLAMIRPYRRRRRRPSRSGLSNTASRRLI